MEGTAEFKIGNATVRIHPGKLSEEEERQTWEQFAKKMLKAAHVARKKQNKEKKGCA